jgi:hypothetical protein
MTTPPLYILSLLCVHFVHFLQGKQKINCILTKNVILVKHVISEIIKTKLVLVNTFQINNIYEIVITCGISRF